MNAQVHKTRTVAGQFNLSLHTLKAVSWSYPTSPNADRFKFPKGCFVVELIAGNKPPQAVAGFATKAEAMQYADSLPNAWSKYTI